MQPARGRYGFRISLAVVLTLSAFTAFMPIGASATELQQTIVRLDDMKTSDNTTGTVCAQEDATTSTAVKSVKVTFPTGFTLGASGTWTVTTTSNPDGITGTQNYWPNSPGGSLATAWPGTLGTGVVSGQSVTFTMTTATALTNSTLYCFNWSNSAALQNPGTATSSMEGTIFLQDGSAATIDTSNFALAVIANDQVVVNATVPPIFQYSISPNISSFSGSLATNSVNISTQSTAQVNTNAKGGWIMWAEDQYRGMRSVAAGHTISTPTWTGSPNTLTAGTEGYALNVVTNPAASGSGCTMARPAEYASAGAQDGGSTTANYQQIGSCLGGVSNGDQLLIDEHVAISTVTPAATDYTDTITVVAAGDF